MSKFVVGQNYSCYTSRTKFDRLEVNPPSLEALEKYIVETTRAIFDADAERDELETFELEFISNLLCACCEHKIDRLFKKEVLDDGDC